MSQDFCGNDKRCPPEMITVLPPLSYELHERICAGIVMGATVGLLGSLMVFAVLSLVRWL